MSAVATSTLLGILIVAAFVLHSWRTILKVAIASVFVLAAVGMAEIAAVVAAGLAAD